MSIENIRRIKEESKLPKPKKVYTIRKVSKKKAAQLATQEDNDELKNWYENIMQKEDGRCWETFEKIDKRDKIGWHGSISHVLPKSLFPSVATHPLNYMILSMWNGSHANFDSSWERAQKMKIWPYAMKIIIQLYPLLPTEERRKLPDCIIQFIPPEIYNSSQNTTSK